MKKKVARLGTRDGMGAILNVSDPGSQPHWSPQSHVNLAKMPAKRKDLPEGMFRFWACAVGAHWDIGLEELENDSNRVQCLPCKAHVFGFSPFQRKCLKKHLESQAHQCAVRTAAKAKEEESATRIKVRRLDIEALEAEAKAFVSPLSGVLPTNHSSTPRVLVNRDETLREQEMWERFKMDGIECTESLAGHDDANEEDAVDAALRCLQAINLGAVGPTDPSPFYDDGDETITNIMREIGNVPALYL